MILFNHSCTNNTHLKKKQIVSFCMAMLMLLGNISVFAQTLPTFSSTLFTTANGLCNNTIINLETDSSGYLWIGTANGLSRFDGRRFTNFFHKPGDSLTIGHNFISDILCDRDENIWILHALGLSMFHTKTHQFSNYPITPDFKNYQGNFSVMEDDGDGKIWLGNQHGIAIFDKVSKRFLSYEKTVKTAGDLYNGGILKGISGIKYAGKGKLWLAGSGKLFFYQSNKAGISALKQSGLSKVEGLGISHVDTMNQRVFLSSFNNGMTIFYNKSGDYIETYRTGKEWLSTPTYDPIRCIQPYNRDLMVMISDLGIGFFSNSTSKLFALSPFPYNRELNLQYLLADGEHLWIGTDNGLLLLKKEQVMLENLTPPNPFEGTFSTIQVRAEDNLVLSNNYGVPLVYSTTLQGGRVKILPGVTGVLRYFFANEKGNQWLSTENHVYLLENGTASWRKISLEGENEFQSGLLPRNFAEDKNGNFWLRVRNNGLYKLASNGYSFEKYKVKGLPENGIFSGLDYDPATNTIWISEENQGLFALPDDQNEWTHHPLLLFGTSLKPAKIVLSNKGEVVFPDPSNGIGIYDPSTKQIKLITQKEGLFSNYTSIINRDKDGNFWTISGEGISRISGKDLSITNFSHKDLVKPQNLECGSDGWIYIATSYGIYRFESAKLQKIRASGKLLIDKFEVMGKAVDFSKPIRVLPHENDISIRVSYVDRAPAFTPELEYSFENQKLWISIEDRSLISFSRLEPGNYRLVIREQGEPETKNWQSISWVIEKPVWQKGWFLAVLAGVLGAAIYLFTQKRIRSIREKALLKQKMAETEMAALRAQMNPHFIFNSINCIDAMVQEGDKYNATTYLNKFAKLLRNVLEGSRNATVSLTSDLDTLRLYLELECMRMDENFTWHIDIPDEVAAADIRVPSLIIQPYVENAILHGLRHLSGKKGNLQIRVGLKGDVLSYMITDNGVGREFAKSIQKTQHNSFGLDITRERIEHFNLSNPGSVTIRDFINEKGEAEGTEVLVKLPLN
jgi:ligand-binding sensor domain-containing protein